MANLNTDLLTPSVAIDCVVFGFHENELKVLLLKLKNIDLWALPGGFVHKYVDIETEAHNALELRTGLDNIFLKQFHTFGSVERNDTEHNKMLVDKKVIPEEWFPWFNQRFISIGFYALVEYSQVKEPIPGPISEACEWCSVNDLPPLMLDHEHILTVAHETLKKELNNQPIGLNLLPKRFTIPELQSLYETILGKKLDRRNFRRKVMSFGILVCTNERRTGVAHKAPLLYEFDEASYIKANEAGLSSGW
jgi:ADP-ribose pyrophosphatase YjhB (NUDIX family)